MLRWGPNEWGILLLATPFDLSATIFVYIVLFRVRVLKVQAGRGIVVVAKKDSSLLPLPKHVLLLQPYGLTYIPIEAEVGPHRRKPQGYPDSDDHNQSPLDKLLHAGPLYVMVIGPCKTDS